MVYSVSPPILFADTHNFIANCEQGIYIRKIDERNGTSSHNTIVNNVIVNSRAWLMNLPWDWTGGRRDY